MVANDLSRRESFYSGLGGVAQTEPSVQPLGPDGAQPQSPPPAYPPPYYAAPPPYGAYPRGPARLRYEEGDPVPPGYHVVSPRGRLVIAGTIVFAVSYGIALGAALVDDFNDQTSWLAVPLAGPWLMMYNRAQPRCDRHISDVCFEQSLETILRFYLAVNGVAQAAGATMLGFVSPAASSWSATTATRPSASASCPAGSARPATARCCAGQICGIARPHGDLPEDEASLEERRQAGGPERR